MLLWLSVEEAETKLSSLLAPVVLIAVEESRWEVGKQNNEKQTGLALQVEDVNVRREGWSSKGVSGVCGRDPAAYMLCVGVDPPLLVDAFLSCFGVCWRWFA